MTSMSVNESYLGHYGLAHDPFAARVPGFKFFPAQRKPVLGQLHHLARYSQLLLLVTGPQGSGKSLLRQAMVASSNKQTVQSVVVTPLAAGDAEEVLGQVARALGGRRGTVEAVMAQVGQASLTGQEVYLLVDDAEQLADDAIEVLLQLATGGPEGRAHVFLFGEPSLAARLAALAEDVERFHVIELQPYSEEETRAYLAQRLEGAGGSLECFSEEQLERIHLLAGGWPGSINRLARDELIAMLPGERRRLPAGIWRLPLPGKHLLAAAVVLCGVALAMLLHDGGDQTGSQLSGAQSHDPADVVSPAIEFSGVSQPLPLPLEPQPVARESLAAPGQGAERRELEQLPPPVEVAAVQLPIAETVASTPAASRVEAPRQTPASAGAATPVAPPRSAAASAPAPAKPAASAAAASSASWYLGQPGSNYLLQVLGTRSEQSARSFLGQHGGDYRYFVKQHQGKPLYVVTYGNFASRQDALAAVRRLPATLQAGKPWARSLASVQQEIRQVR